jgi:SPP1 gp7 family putative phage head morphogenesis protein
MPDLLGFSGSKTGGGSLALGKEQFRAFLGVIKKDRESLQNKITERLVKPCAAVNWGPEVAARTSFEFVPFTDENIMDAAKVWTEAVKAVGWDPSDEEINYLRAITGFPEGPVERKAPMAVGPDGMPLPPNQQPGAQGRGMSGAEPGEEGDEPGAGGPTVSGGQPMGKPASAKKFALRTYAGRKVTTYEQKVDFPGVEGVLNASERRALPPLKSAARTIYTDLIDQVRAKGLLRRFRPDAVNDLQPRFLKDMNMVFKNHFTDLFNAASKEAKTEIYKDVKKFSVEDDDPMLPEEFLKILQAESFKIVGDYSTEITKKAKNIIMQGIKDGVGEGPIVAQLREELSDYTERWLGTVVRTKTTEIYNDARKSFWDTDPIAAQVIEAYQFSAILDDRTTDCCRELDGKIFEKGDYLDKVTPPLHFNCRSLLVPVTRFEPYKQDPDYVKPGKEPSLDGLREKGGGLIVGGD